MEWYDSYCIGNDLIDGQHKTLVEIISRLQDSLAHGEIGKELGNTLKFLVEYTQKHFADEEELMRQINYDEYEKHREKHAILISQVTDILLKIKKGKQIDPLAIFDFLVDWLLTHIKNEDKRIGKALEHYQSD